MPVQVSRLNMLFSPRLQAESMPDILQASSAELDAADRERSCVATTYPETSAVDTWQQELDAVVTIAAELRPRAAWATQVQRSFAAEKAVRPVLVAQEALRA